MPQTFSKDYSLLSETLKILHKLSDDCWKEYFDLQNKFVGKKAKKTHDKVIENGILRFAELNNKIIDNRNTGKLVLAYISNNFI